MIPIRNHVCPSISAVRNSASQFRAKTSHFRQQFFSTASLKLPAIRRSNRLSVDYLAAQVKRSWPG